MKTELEHWQLRTKIGIKSKIFSELNLSKHLTKFMPRHFLWHCMCCWHHFIIIGNWILSDLLESNFGYRERQPTSSLNALLCCWSSVIQLLHGRHYCRENLISARFDDSRSQKPHEKNTGNERILETDQSTEVICLIVSLVEMTAYGWTVNWF